MARDSCYQRLRNSRTVCFELSHVKHNDFGWLVIPVDETTKFCHRERSPRVLHDGRPLLRSWYYTNAMDESLKLLSSLIIPYERDSVCLLGRDLYIPWFGEGVESKRVR